LYIFLLQFHSSAELISVYQQLVAALSVAEKVSLVNECVVCVNVLCVSVCLITESAV